MKNNHRGKGDQIGQKKRRKERLKHLPDKRKEPVVLIDGNESHYPVAYCTYHNGYLTEGLLDTHRCKERNCHRLRMVKQHEIK